MSSIKYYIERRRDELGRVRTRNIPILLYFSFDGNRFQLYTGERVDMGDWDSKNQCVKNGVPGSKQINRYLSFLGEEVRSIYLEALSIGIQPGTRYIRDQLRSRRRKIKVDFFDVLMRFIDENHNQWSIHTFRKVRTAYNHLRQFSETEQINIEFERIDPHFIERYARFFRIKYNHTNTTILKNINVLKWFLNWAAKRGYNRSRAYLDYEFNWEARPRIRDDDLVLSWEELLKLSDFKPSAENLMEVRDIFCFMCFTGFRLSKVYQMKKGNVFADFVRMAVPRDGTYINYPLNENAGRILAGYSGRNYPGDNCFPYYPNPYFNKLLKQLGREAGINRFVSLEVYSGTELGKRQVPKYEILTSKMAVNTFVFNGLRLNIPAEILAHVCGRSTVLGIEKFRPLVDQVSLESVREFDNLKG